MNPVLYFLKDLQGDRLLNKSFYRSQLIRTKEPTDSFFLIEKVLKRRTIEGVKELYVKFLYYPNKVRIFLAQQNIRKWQKKRVIFWQKN